MAGGGGYGSRGCSRAEGAAEAALPLSAGQRAWRAFRVLLCTNYVAFGRVAGGTGRVEASEWRRGQSGWRCAPNGGERGRGRGREGRQQQRDLSCEERARCLERTRPKLRAHGHTSREPDSDITRRATQLRARHRDTRTTATPAPPQHAHHRGTHTTASPHPRCMATDALQPVEAAARDAPPEPSAEAAPKPPVRRSWR